MTLLSEAMSNFNEFLVSAKSILAGDSLTKYGHVAIFLLVTYLVTSSVYTVYFHPLAKFPGPKSAAISNIFYSKAIVSGNSAKIVKSMHDKYGDVIRWGPNELSFASADAWKDIYDRRPDGKVLVKDPLFYRTDDTFRAKHIVNTSDPELHAQMRKMMSHAFSAKALLGQEDIIQRYADDLLVAIREKGAEAPINLIEFFNWTTFDVLGELAFGESFHSLSNRKTDPWIAIILDSIKFNAWDVAIWKLPVLPWLQYWLTPTNIREGGIKHAIESKEKILKRAREKTDRKDFVSYILAKRQELGITDWEMAAHSNALIVAGSETSATTLSGLHYWLLRTPQAYKKLREEVRGRYKSLEEVDARSAAVLPYMTACIDETFRIYPPIPIGMPRVTPKEGCTISGQWVPGGTTVAVHMWSVTHNPKNFSDPNVFRPDRWLDPESTDIKEASKPFLTGPRMCMGINMAWIEVRILLAKLTLLYDFELQDKNLDWMGDQRCYTLWEKPDLFVKVTPVTPASTD